LPKISGDLPGSYINIIECNLPKDIHLADSGFSQPGKIDLMIRMETFFHHIKAGRETRAGLYPVMQDTEFGWILAGQFQPVQPTNAAPPTLKTFFLRSDISQEWQLQWFWEMEELNHPPRSKEQTDCEQHFISSIIRDVTGCFIVHLPF
jgi:hypothetical protein